MRQVQNIGYQGYSQLMSWFCAKVVISSSSICLIIDGTSDESNTRKPLTILMSGRDKNDMFWCVPMRFTEPKDHTAETQLKEIELLFEQINDLLNDHIDGIWNK